MDDGNVSAGIEIRHVEALRDRLRDVAQEDTFFLHRVIRRHARSRVLGRQIMQAYNIFQRGCGPAVCAVAHTGRDTLLACDLNHDRVMANARFHPSLVGRNGALDDLDSWSALPATAQCAVQLHDGQCFVLLSDNKIQLRRKKVRVCRQHF
jgi:hypothetical protein